MSRVFSIALIIIYANILFAHTLLSIGHSALHYTAKIVAIHDHGHSHDHAVTDHNEGLSKPTEDADDSTAADFNILSLIGYYHSTLDINLCYDDDNARLRKNEGRLNFKSHFIKPLVPPPIV